MPYIEFPIYTNGVRWGITTGIVGKFDIRHEGVAPRLIIDTNGYVGIGISSPTSRLHVNGNFTATGTKSATVETEHYGTRKLYAIEAPDVRFIDVVKVDNLEGEQWVEINPMFAETISDYEVFYNGTVEILEKQPGRFKVHGSGRAAFLIYGKRKGYEGVYMEQVGGEEVEHRRKPCNPKTRSSNCRFKPADSGIAGTG